MGLEPEAKQSGVQPLSERSALPNRKSLLILLIPVCFFTSLLAASWQPRLKNISQWLQAICRTAPNHRTLTPPPPYR